MSEAEHLSAEFELLSALAEVHPHDVAVQLERITPEVSARILSELSAQHAGRVLTRMAPNAAGKCVGDVEVKRAAAILVKAGPVSAAQALARVPAEKRQQLLLTMPKHVSEATQRLLGHAEQTAGAIMDPLALAIADDATVEQALAQIKEHFDNALYYLYVVARGGQLVGVCTLRQLMGERPAASVREVMVPEPVAVLSTATLLSVLANPAWRSFHALPVVDRHGVYLGAIRYETARAVEYDLGQGIRDGAATETARALGDFYALGVLGIARSLLPGSTEQRKKLGGGL